MLRSVVHTAAWAVLTLAQSLPLVGLFHRQTEKHPRRLPSLGLGLQFSIMSASLTLLLLLSFWITRMISQTILPGRQVTALLTLGVSVILATAITLLYKPYRAFVARLIQAIIPAITQDPEKILRQYRSTISGVIDLEPLANAAIQAIRDALDVQQASIILVCRTERGIHLRLLAEQWDDAISPEIPIGADSPWIKCLEEAKGPLSRSELTTESARQNLTPGAYGRLEEIDAEIYAPILTQSTLIGILAVGTPRSGAPFNARGRAFLSALAEQTATALKNACAFADLKAHNQELQRRIKSVERLEQAKSDFLSIVSHELRTPLTHVKGYADLLSELCHTETIDREQIVDITHSLNKGANRLEAIVKAIIDLSQIEEETLELYFTPTTLEAVTRLALKMWMTPLRLRDIHLSTDGIDAIPPIIVDLQRLAQAFSNLISNAVKYTPDGGKITIRARQIDADYFKVTVIDTGVGIAPSDQEMIFDKFFQTGKVDQHTSGTHQFMSGGPGLGLSIARGIIQAHGGRIWVTSAGYDKTTCPGSAFHVLLPLKARDLAALASNADLSPPNISQPR